MALIRGISFDFDGSLSRIGEDKDVIRANSEFLDFIRAQNHKYAKTYGYIGSNRQSIYDDSVNAFSNRNGSCYPQIRKVCDYIGAIFDSFTLTDLYNNLEAGQSVQLALSLLKRSKTTDEKEDSYVYDPDRIKQTQTPDWLHDESKLSLLIAQIHKLASEHPDDEIEFYFYDDKKEILDRLSTFFDIPENRQLLPRNLKQLHLVPYPAILQEKTTLHINEKLNTPPSIMEAIDIPPTEKEEGSVLLAKQPEDLAEENMASFNLGNKAEIQFVSYPPISGIGDIDFNYRQTVQTMAAVCIESQRYQETLPTDTEANRVRNYEQAARGNFVLSTVMSFVLDYVPGSSPKISPITIPARLRTLSPEPKLSLQQPLSSKSDSSEKPTSVSSKHLLGFLPGFLKGSKSKQAKNKEKKEKEVHKKDKRISNTKDKEKKSTEKIEKFETPSKLAPVASAKFSSRQATSKNSMTRPQIPPDSFFTAAAPRQEETTPQGQNSSITLSSYREPSQFPKHN